MKKIPQDIIGDIALLKFPRKTLWLTKKIKARKFLKQNKTVKTVLEKTEGFSGELRTLKTKHLAGLKTKEATYKENNCTFKFNVDESYFSPRLSNERKIIADEIAKLAPETPKHRNTETPAKMLHILIMFAGIAPYPIVIAKRILSAVSRQQSTNFHIYANELNEKANIAAKKNITLNKLNKYITLVPGDANTLPRRLTAKRSHSEAVSQRSGLQNYDVILMPRPNLKETFLKTALKLAKKNTTIFYHGFGTKKEVLDEIKKDTKNKIGKISIRKAGDIAAHKYRWQAKFKVK